MLGCHNYLAVGTCFYCGKNYHQLHKQVLKFCSTIGQHGQRVNYKDKNIQAVVYGLVARKYCKSYLLSPYICIQWYYIILVVRKPVLS